MKISGYTNFGQIFTNAPTLDSCESADSVPTDECGLRNHNLESWLEINYAKVIHDLQKEVDDYPVYACCSCERLHQCKSVTRVTLDDNLGVVVWPRLKS